MLLAAGSPDYCIVELKAGMVRVRLDLGSGEAVLGSPPGIKFDDWHWHHMHLVRNSDEVGYFFSTLWNGLSISLFGPHDTVNIF